MTSLAAKDAYLQKLGSKVCAAQKLQLRKRPFVPYRGGEAGQPKTKKKSRQKPPGGKKYDRQGKLPPAAAAADATALKTGEKVPVKPAQNGDHKPAQSGDAKPLENGTPVKGVKAAPSSFFTVDILRQRLHEKIEETRGHGNAKGLSAEELERKRSRRKQERDRKKRKRKEIRRKQLAEKEAGEIKAEEEEKEEKEPQNRVGTAKPESTLVFNKVDVGDEIASKTLQKKQKKKSVKGNLTPLIGKNYKQLLSRVEARKAKLEELRGKDEGKAKEMEEKIKWTNVLYKAEGLKIKDNEELLRASLKRKEKNQAAKKKRWGERSEHVLEKMQHRQDKRRRNIQKQKHSKSEKRKDKARKKGRVLPEDLKKAI